MLGEIPSSFAALPERISSRGQVLQSGNRKVYLYTVNDERFRIENQSEIDDLLYWGKEYLPGIVPREEDMIPLEITADGLKENLTYEIEGLAWQPGDTVTACAGEYTLRIETGEDQEDTLTQTIEIQEGTVRTYATEGERKGSGGNAAFDSPRRKMGGSNAGSTDGAGAK